MRRPLIVLIQIYRYAVSPVMGCHCRFYPSCSTYALEAVEHHGAIRGCLLAAMRLLKCHPWHHGGYDPVPTSPEPG